MDLLWEECIFNRSSNVFSFSSSVIKIAYLFFYINEWHVIIVSGAFGLVKRMECFIPGVSGKSESIIWENLFEWTISVLFVLIFTLHIIPALCMYLSSFLWICTWFESHSKPVMFFTLKIIQGQFVICEVKLFQAILPYSQALEKFAPHIQQVKLQRVSFVNCLQRLHDVLIHYTFFFTNSGQHGEQWERGFNWRCSPSFWGWWNWFWWTWN